MLSAYATLMKLIYNLSTKLAAHQGTKYYGVHLTTKSLKTPFKETDPRCGPLAFAKPTCTAFDVDMSTADQCAM